MIFWGRMERVKRFADENGKSEMICGGEWRYQNYLIGENGESDMICWGRMERVK